MKSIKLERTTTIVPILSILLMFSGFSCQAEEERGLALALVCSTCHGSNGYSPSNIPSLAGKSAKLLVRRLNSFKQSTDTATIMGRLAKGYSDTEISALAEYFSHLSTDHD